MQCRFCFFKPAFRFQMICRNKALVIHALRVAKYSQPSLFRFTFFKQRGLSFYREQRTKTWLIHGLWTKPLVHGLPWTCQEVISQWLQQRNFRTMDLEDPSSRSTSSSSSNSASSSESLFAFVDPSSTSDLFSSSSSASQSSAAAAVKWVDRSGNKNWDSPMCQLGIFKCSENKQVNHRYLLKCVVCEQHHSSFVWHYSFLWWCCTLLYGTEWTQRR